MSLKDQMPFFSNPPAWYYRMMAVLCCIAAVPFLCVSVMCLLWHEYWPLLIFGVVIFCMVFSARGLWQRARTKKKRASSKRRHPMPSNALELSSVQLASWFWFLFWFENPACL
jgi:hypothetical protein